MLDIIDKCPKLGSIQQPEAIPKRKYRHSDKKPDHGETVAEKYDSANLMRYTFYQHHRSYMQRMSVGREGESRLSSAKRVFAKIAIRNLTKDELSPGLYVLTYHDIYEDSLAAHCNEEGVPLIFIGKSNFRSHLEYLKSEFDCVPLSTGVEMWRNGLGRSKRIVAITFDDGLAGISSSLKEMSNVGIPPTIFLCGNPLFRNKPLQVHKDYLVEKYCYMHGEKRAQIANLFNGMLCDGFVEPNKFTQYVTKSYLSVSAVHQLLGKNLVSDIGSHTWDHSSLAGDNYKVQQQKINDNHEHIQMEFGNKVKYFSFPFGKLDRLSFASEYAARLAPKEAFQCNGGVNQNAHVPGSILRVAVPDGNVEMLKRLLGMQWVR